MVEKDSEEKKWKLIVTPWYIFVVGLEKFYIEDSNLRPIFDSVLKIHLFFFLFFLRFKWERKFLGHSDSRDNYTIRWLFENLCTPRDPNTKCIVLTNFPSTIMKREWERGMTIILPTLQINIYRPTSVNFMRRLFRWLVCFISREMR